LLIGNLTRPGFVKKIGGEQGGANVKEPDSSPVQDGEVLIVLLLLFELYRRVGGQRIIEKT
jgi:hypothetical protein